MLINDRMAKIWSRSASGMEHQYRIRSIPETQIVSVGLPGAWEAALAGIELQANGCIPSALSAQAHELPGTALGDRLGTPAWRQYSMSLMSDRRGKELDRHHPDSTKQVLGYLVNCQA